MLRAEHFWTFFQNCTVGDYQLIVSELINDGEGGSINNQIVQELVSQNSEFQKQVWGHQQQKFDERKRRWMEVVGFIFNRGNRDWTGSLNGFVNQWRKWRIEAREDISRGEKAWLAELNNFNLEKSRWQADTSKSASEESARMMMDDLSQKINGFTNSMSLPDNLKINIDTESILNNIFKNQPATDIGVLSNSMNSVDTVAGFSDFLNLNISSALSKRYSTSMKDYESHMKIMQNLQVIDIFHEIIDAFNEQLAEQNEDSFKSVDADLRQMSYWETPFIRMPASNLWLLRYCDTNTMVSSPGYTVFPIPDYTKYTTNIVKLKPFKGIDGTVDFLKPRTYMHLDPEELNIFTQLESEHLNRAIESVFAPKTGTYTAHVSGEFERLDKMFEEGEKRYNQGIVLGKKKFYEYDEFIIANAVIGAACVIAAPFTCGATLYAYIAMNVAMNTTIGAMEGGVVGGLTKGISGAASAIVQGYSGGALSFDVGYSYEDGWGGSVSAGYKGAGVTLGYSEKAGFSVGGGFTGFGIDAGIGWSEEEGFGGHVGVSLKHKGSGMSGGLGMSYSQKNGFGAYLDMGYSKGSGGISAGATWNQQEGFGANVSATARFKKNNFSGGLTVGAAWSQKHGFSGKVDLSTKYKGKKYSGGLSAGLEYNFSKRKITNAYAGLNLASGTRNLQGKTSLGFSYNHKTGYGLSARTSVNIKGSGTQTALMSTDASFNWGTNGAYKGSSMNRSAGRRYDYGQGMIVKPEAYEISTEEKQEEKRAEENSREAGSHAGAGALAAAGIAGLRGNSRNLEEEIASGASASMGMSQVNADAIAGLSGTPDIRGQGSDYEIVMTDSGPARRYADGSFEFIDEVTLQAERYKQTYGGEITNAAYKPKGKNKSNKPLVDGSDEYYNAKKEVYDAVEYGSKSKEYNKIMEELGYNGNEFKIREKGDYTIINENSSDGLSKNTRVFYGDELTFEKFDAFNYENGKAIRDYTTEYFPGIGDDMTKVHDRYDASGRNVYNSNVYQKNLKTGDYELDYFERKFLDNKGNVVPDRKQERQYWSNDSLYTSSSRIGSIGCVVATYGNMTDRTPRNTDRILDNLANSYGGYAGQRADLSHIDPNNMLIDSFARYNNMSLHTTVGNSNIRKILDSNVNNEIRTEIRFTKHSTMLSGARYDSNGNITDYLIHDPGRRNNTAISRRYLTHQDWGDVRKVRWLTNNN